MSPGLDTLVVTPFGSMGGAERWLLDLVDHADHLAIRVVALEEGPMVPALAARQVPVVVRPTGASPLAMATTAVWLAGHVRRRRPDVILANGVKAAAAAVPAGRLSGVPTTWVKHDFARDRTLARPLGRMADRVLAVSPAVAQATRRTDVVLVPPTLSATPVDAATARAFWAEHGVPLDAPTVAMVARLAPIKGVDDAITALASPEASEWRLVVIGGDDPAWPDERLRLRQLARDRGVEDRVHLVGWVEDAARWLAAFDAVAILTRTGPGGFGREGFGLAALEALRAGVPVVAAEGNPEVVRLAAHAGAIVPPNAPAAVARALSGLGHVDRARLRAVADDHPAPAEVAGRVTSTLTATVGRRRGGGDRGVSTTGVDARPVREGGARRTVLHVFEPAGGGVPAFVQALATVQAGRGHDVHVLAPAGWEGAADAAAASWQIWSWDPQRWGPRDLWAASRRYGQVVASVRPDTVHLHSFYAGLVGRLRRRQAGATVYQPHAWPFARAGVGGGVARALERGLGRRTDVLVAVSETEAEEGRATGVTTPAVTCSVPVDLQRFVPPSHHVRARHRERLGLDPETRAVVSVGRLSPQKGQDLLVRQWLRHRRVLDDAGAQLFLVGPGDTRQVAEWAGDALGRTVHHVGGVADVRPWLAVADVVVQSSRWEGMSIAVAESLACGVPVVATDVAGMREMVGAGPGAAGAVVPRDASSLVPAVLERLRSNDLRCQESRAARARATELFAPEQVTDRVEIAYEVAAGRRST